MGVSVIYSSVMSCILASMSSLRTRVVAFDTPADVLLQEPVDLLHNFLNKPPHAVLGALGNLLL